MVTRALLVAALFGVAGCAVFNGPKREDLGTPHPDDGGEAGTPEGGEDGGLDGGEGGVDAGCQPRPENCADPRVDLDCDDFRGCEDIDCASTPTCCGAMGAPFILPTAPMREVWNTGWDVRWTGMPAGNPPTIGSPITDMIFGSPGDPTVRGALYNGAPGLGSCAPLGYGFSTELTIRYPATIDAGDFASLVLAEWNVLGTAPPDLDVRIDAAGVHVLSGGGDLAGSPFRPTAGSTTGTFVLRVEVSPGLDGGVPVVAARVSWSADGAMFQTEVIDRPFARLSSLVSASLCGGQSPGLYYMVTGRGSSVRVRTVEGHTLSCANPSKFDVGPGAAPMFGSFAAGGAAGPALAAHGSAGSRLFDLYADGSPDPRENEGIAPVHFAIGMTTGSGWPPASWSGGTTSAIEDASSSRREPAVLVASPSPLIVKGFFAQETATPGAYRLAAFTATGGGAPVVDASPFAVDSDCSSQRDPAIARDSRGDGSDTSPVLLFYTCEHDVGPPEIRSVQLTFDTYMPMTGTERIALTSAVGAYAAAGVRGPEALLRYDPAGHPEVRLRVYFVAESSSGRTLAMAQGQGTDVAGALDTLAPFAGNPILRGNESTLGGCPSGPGDHCDISGFAIVRDPDVAVLREVVARRVNDGAVGVSWELVPATQTLETFW